MHTSLAQTARLAAATLCVALAALARVRAAEETPLQVVVHQPVYPVLTRKEHNPIAQIQIVVPHGHSAVSLQSVKISLEGTDDLADIEALQLFRPSDPAAFPPHSQFGPTRAAAAQVEFTGKFPLSPGSNTLWLSCRLKDSAALSHRIAATCLSVVTSAGALEPSGSAATLRRRIGVALRKHFDDGVHTHRIPALATSAQGALLAVYDLRRREGRDLQGDIDIGLSRSLDQGQHWESPRVIMDMGESHQRPQQENGCSDPGIIVDRQTGEIFVFAVWMNGKPGQHQWTGSGSEPGFEIGKSAQILLVRSRDDGKTWSPPENLTRKLKKESWWLIAPSPQQGIQLQDGTLVQPAQGRDDRGVPFATLLVSRDHGVQWQVASPAFSGGNECQAAQLGDGALMLNIRNDLDRTRAVMVTTDLGQSWAPHATHRRDLIEPNCNASLIRVDYSEKGLPRHALLFANPRSQTARTHHTLQVSFDDGRTWPESHRLLLDEGRGAGYPSLTRIDEHHVGIVYEGSQAQLVFERFTLSELGIPQPGLRRP